MHKAKNLSLTFACRYVFLLHIQTDKLFPPPDTQTHKHTCRLPLRAQRWGSSSNKHCFTLWVRARLKTTILCIENQTRREKIFLKEKKKLKSSFLSFLFCSNNTVTLSRWTENKREANHDHPYSLSPRYKTVEDARGTRQPVCVLSSLSCDTWGNPQIQRSQWIKHSGSRMPALLLSIYLSLLFKWYTVVVCVCLCLEDRRSFGCSLCFLGILAPA